MGVAEGVAVLLAVAVAVDVAANVAVSVGLGVSVGEGVMVGPSNPPGPQAEDSSKIAAAASPSLRFVMLASLCRIGASTRYLTCPL